MGPVCEQNFYFFKTKQNLPPHALRGKTEGDFKMYTFSESVPDTSPLLP